MTQKQKISADRVREIFEDCCSVPQEHVATAFKAVEGILPKHGVWFHVPKLESYRDEIAEMLMHLPEEFHENIGGGYSFLNACNDCFGDQWDGDHATMEKLVQLGLGIDKVVFNAPRDMWDALPGGMPYFMVRFDESAIQD